MTREERRGAGALAVGHLDAVTRVAVACHRDETLVVDVTHLLGVCVSEREAAKFWRCPTRESRRRRRNTPTRTPTAMDEFRADALEFRAVYGQDMVPQWFADASDDAKQLYPDSELDALRAPVPPPEEDEEDEATCFAWFSLLCVG